MDITVIRVLDFLPLNKRIFYSRNKRINKYTLMIIYNNLFVDKISMYFLCYISIR